MNDKVVYLSHPISTETPLYGGENNVQIKSNTTISSGDTANSLNLFFPNHAGTHVDVPYHFFDDGKKLTDYAASFWIFTHPVCIDVPGEDGYLVSYKDVTGKINKETDLLLIRTGYEKYRSEPKYYQKNPGLSADLAKGLRANYPNIRAMGVDVISITSRLHRDEGREAHLAFLNPKEGHPILLIEDMKLDINSPFKKVLVAPLLIENADGVPCTVFSFS